MKHLKEVLDEAHMLARDVEVVTISGRLHHARIRAVGDGIVSLRPINSPAGDRDVVRLRMDTIESVRLR